MRKVSEEEVTALYRFTRQHYVEFYDVQTELVDHLANGIEAQWKDNPDISFEEALQKEFKKFGVYGFSEVVEKRQRSMEKKYWKLIWKEGRNILSKPKVVFAVFSLFWFFYSLLIFQEGVYALMVLVVLIGIFTIFFVGKKSAVLKKKKKKGEKIYLLETIIFNTGGSFSLLWLPFHVLNLEGAPDNLYLRAIMAFIIVVIALTSYICFYVLPRKKDEILKKVHPEIKYFQ